MFTNSKMLAGVAIIAMLVFCIYGGHALNQVNFGVWLTIICIRADMEFSIRTMLLNYLRLSLTKENSY